MTPLFDQDSAASSEKSPAGGAPPGMAGHDESGSRDEATDERPTYPDPARSISPGPGPGESAAPPDEVDGADRAEPRVEPAATADSTGEGETGSPADVDPAPDAATHAPDGAVAPNGADAGIESDAGADDANGAGGIVGGQLEEERAELETGSAPPDTAEPAQASATAETAPPGAEAEPEADPTATVGSETAPSDAETAPPGTEAEPDADPTATFGSETAPSDAETAPSDAETAPSDPISIPPPTPPTLAVPAPPAPAPTAPPEPTVGPPPAALTEPLAAPSSAGPPPSQLASQPLSPSGVGERVVSGFKQLLPTPVRAHPDQRVYSLVMLLTLAVTVGIVGAGVLVALVFIIIGTLGHG